MSSECRHCGKVHYRSNDSARWCPQTYQMLREQAAQQVRQAARTATYHKGPATTYDDVAAMCTPDTSPRFICEQAELAGFPVWSSAPDEAMKP